MNSPENYEQQLQDRERQLREKEAELRLRELETETSDQDPKFYRTVKHQSENTEQPVWQKKTVLGLKLFGLGVVALVAVRLAATLAGFLIVGALIFAGYKLFFDNKK